ncbi:cadherin-like domain-containing protein, partial [Legionella sp. CNM-4043-24]|uniref:cadherin-like domain-containing protein n=1 Tax=Legionella sp. CNM-4043-24 TaxID=3421646 RepID=UPI00403B1E02
MADIQGDDDDNVIIGTLLNDRILGGLGNDNINGRNGDDIINGDDGDDRLIGGNGDDTISGDAGNDSISGGLGNDTLIGGLDDDWLSGDGGDDSISGSDGNDRLYGGTGNDSINGDAGNDRISGGTGIDTLSGGSGADNISGDDGNDLIYGGDGSDRLAGGRGDDTIFGDADADSISGGIGNDSLSGDLGDDWLSGDDGNDTISGGDGSDRLFGGLGDDFILGDADSDSISGGAGVDTLFGGSGDDIINGDDGNDIISGGDGVDRLIGGQGDDTINGDADNDSVSSGIGNDTINGGLGDDWLSGDDGNDIINGGDGNDRLYGGRGNDSVHGDAGDDIIYHNVSQNAGNIDAYDGGADNDTLILQVSKQQYAAIVSAGITTDFASNPAGNSFDFNSYSGVLGFDLNISIVGIENLVFIQAATNTNDVAPVITSSNSFSALENINDTAVIGQVIFTDQDTVNGTTTYRIVNDPDNLFEISATGEISLQAGKQLNFESQSSHSISVVVNDGTYDSAVQVITIGVQNVNEAPMAGAGVVLTSIAEDSGARVITQAELLANASDVDAGSSLEALNLSIASGSGTLVDNNDGTWTYTPALNDNSSVSFNFNISDGSLSVPSTASLDITPVNDAPVAGASVALTAIAEDSGARVITQAELLANASDVDAGSSLEALNLSIASGSGTLVDNNDGTWTYTPALNDESSVSFNFDISDGSVSVASTASLDITPVNDAPTAGAAVVLTAIAEDSGARLITQAELLANASDVDAGSSLEALNLSIASGSGTLVDNNDGTWTYTPALNDNSSVSFNFDISDGSLSVPSTASLDITPVNDAPVAGASVALTAIAEDSGARVITQAELLANASDVDAGSGLEALNLSIASGSGTLVDNNDGTWTYTPALNDESSVSFNFDISDGIASVPSTASLDITPVNDAPTAGASVVLTAIVEDSGARVITQAELLANASDVDAGSSLEALNLSIASGSGTLVDNLDGTWTYTPALNDESSVSFNFNISDGSTSVASTASLDITPVNNAPVAGAAVVLTAIAEDSGARVITQAELLANASDVDAGSSLEALNLSIASGSGTLVDNNDGTWTYTPALNDESSVSFNFDISDGIASVPSTASLDITPVNDAPTAGASVVLTAIAEDSGA